MKYYFHLDTFPDSPKYGEPLALVRVEDGGIPERWDIPTNKWILAPFVAREMSGIGGDGFGWVGADDAWEKFIKDNMPAHLVLGQQLIESIEKALTELNGQDVN